MSGHLSSFAEEVKPGMSEIVIDSEFGPLHTSRGYGIVQNM
jgi:hypothetical protein